MTFPFPPDDDPQDLRADPLNPQPPKMWLADKVVDFDGYSVGFVWDDSCVVVLYQKEGDGWSAVAWLPPEVIDAAKAFAAVAAIGGEG
jgi:hypothetical protein